MRKLKQKNLVALMRKFSLGGCFAALFMALCISACSDDDDTTKAVFPEKQTVNCVYGDTKELNFEASANWQLTSSATWCRFVNDGYEDYSLSGTAGKQTVTLKITDEAVAFDAPTVARLTMTIGAEKAIIADVVRDNKMRELKIYDMEGNEIHEIEVGYDNYKPFQVKANFRFAATNRPEWLEIAGNAIVGTANEMTKGEVQVSKKSPYAKYEQSGTLTFADEDGVKSFSFPLVYAGMDPKSIEIQSPTTDTWNWEVSLDGQVFTNTGSVGSNSSSTYNKFVPYTVQALNDKVVPVYMAKIEYINQLTGETEVAMDIAGVNGAEIDWMKISDDKKGNLRLTVDEASEKSEGYVLIFSEAAYEEIKNDLENKLIKTNEKGEPDFNDIYLDNNLLIHFVQKEKKQEVAQAFKVTYSLDYGVTKIELTCTKVTDADILDKYPGLNEIYTVEWPADYVGNGVEIDPLEGEVETDWSYVLMCGSEDKSNDTDYIEPSASVVTVYAVPRTTEYHLQIKKDSETTKVLIITPNYN